MSRRRRRALACVESQLLQNFPQKTMLTSSCQPPPPPPLRRASLLTRGVSQPICITGAQGPPALLPDLSVSLSVSVADDQPSANEKKKHTRRKKIWRFWRQMNQWFFDQHVPTLSGGGETDNKWEDLTSLLLSGWSLLDQGGTSHRLLRLKPAQFSPKFSSNKMWK